MGSSKKSQVGYVTRWLPLAFPVIAIAGLLTLAWLQPDPIMGEVLSVRVVSHGERLATVEYVDTTGEPPVTVIEEMELPRAHWGSDRVPIWPGNEREPARIGLFGQIEITPLLVAVTAGIATLLGKVVEMTHRGYGYVRGTAEPGQTPPEQVAEDRGFYWRT